MKCPICNGWLFNDTSSCTFCWGKKELDWIECIVGVNKQEWRDDMQKSGYRKYSLRDKWSTYFKIPERYKYEMSKM